MALWPPRLDHDGRVPEDEAGEALRLQLGQACRERVADGRMRDGLQPAAPLGVGEDDGAQALAIERAVRAAARRRRTPATIAASAGWPGRDDLAREEIRVDDRRSRDRGGSSETVLLPVAMPPVRPTSRKRRLTRADQSRPVLTSTTIGHVQRQRRLHDLAGQRRDRLDLVRAATRTAARRAPAAACGAGRPARRAAPRACAPWRS